MVSQHRFVWLWYQSVLVNFYPNLNSSLYHTDTLLVICLILLWFLLFYCFTVLLFTTLHGTDCLTHPHDVRFHHYPRSQVE